MNEVTLGVSPSVRNSLLSSFLIVCRLITRGFFLLPSLDACTWQGAASVIQTDALGESQEIAHLDTGHYFGEVR